MLVVFKVGCGSSVLVVLGVGHCACSVQGWVWVICTCSVGCGSLCL